jgi:hypothetical protein
MQVNESTRNKMVQFRTHHIVQTWAEPRIKNAVANIRLKIIVFQTQQVYNRPWQTIQCTALLLKWIRKNDWTCRQVMFVFIRRFTVHKSQNSIIKRVPMPWS